MTHVALIVKEDGLIYAAELPEEPKHNGYYPPHPLVDEKALASAKENAVLCADQEQARELVMRKSSMGKDKDGFYQPTVGVHPIPDLKFTINAECPTWCSDCEAFDWSTCKDKYLAILTLSEQPKEEESQEELTALNLKMFIERELGGYKTVHMGRSYRVINRQFVYESDIMSLAEDLLSNFTITRNLKSKII